MVNVVHFLIFKSQRSERRKDSLIRRNLFFLNLFTSLLKTLMREKENSNPYECINLKIINEMTKTNFHLMRKK